MPAISQSHHDAPHVPNIWISTLGIGQSPVPWRKIGGTALTSSLALAVGIVLGHIGWGIWAFLGGFTSFYVAGQPYRERRIVLVWVALGMAVAMALGSLSVVWWAMALALGMASLVATFVAGAFRVPLPGGFMFILVAAISAALPSPSHTPTRVLFVLVGGTLAWMIGMVGQLVNARAPEGRMVASAYDAVGRYLTHLNTPGSLAYQNKAAQAIYSARSAVAVSSAQYPITGRLTYMTRRAEDIFLAAVALSTQISGPLSQEWGHYVRNVARLINPRATVPNSPFLSGRGPLHNQFIIAVSSSVHQLQDRREPGRRPLFHMMNGPARARRAFRAAPIIRYASLRMGLAVGLSVVIAHLIGFSHPYWVPLTVAAVLEGNTVLAFTARAVQRVIGTFLGILLAWGLIVGLHPSVIEAFGLVVLLQALMLILMTKNYAISVIPMTAFSMLIIHASSPVHTPPLLTARMWDTLLGVTVALAATFLLWSKVPSRHLQNTLADAVRQEGRLLQRLLNGHRIKNELKDRVHASILRTEALANDALGELPPSIKAKRLWPALRAMQQLGYLILSARNVPGIPTCTPAPQVKDVFDRIAKQIETGAAVTIPDVPKVWPPIDRKLQTLIDSLP